MIRIASVRQVDENGDYVSLGKNEFAKYSDSDEVIFRALNEDYTVTLNGIPASVRECRVSAMPFNRPWPGKQRPWSQSESAGILSFCADEAVTLRVSFKAGFGDAVVRPLSCGIVPRVEGESLVFTLTEPGCYVLEPNGWHHALHIFFNPIKEAPLRESVTYYFGPGMHFPGNILLRDNDSVYVDPDATVFGSLNSLGAKNIRVFGGGVIDGSYEERLTEQCYENHTKGNVRLYNCQNVLIEDVILTNSATWSLALFGCDGVKVDGVKIVGQWRYNTDGVDLVNCRNAVIENCFIRSFDDTVTIKGIYNHPLPIENVRVERCVLWCGWGNACEVGIETAAVAYKDITFSDCDVIHTSGPALAVLNGCQAQIERVLFRDVRVEFQSGQLPQILQTSETQVYDPSAKRAEPSLVKVNNRQFDIRVKSSEGVARAMPKQLGRVRDVRFERIRVFTDRPDIRPTVKITCVGDRENISDITFEEFYWNGEVQPTLERFDLIFENH